MTTDDAIQHAAQYLPEGWELIIAVECGSAGVELFDGQGEQRNDRHPTSPEGILDMVDCARRMAGALSVARPS